MPLFKTQSLDYVLRSSHVHSAAPILIEYTKKEFLSNLGLTVFVRHLVDLVKQVPVVSPQGRKECFTWELYKEIGTATVFSVFVHYHQQKNNALRCSLSYVSRGSKVCLIRSPHSCLHKGPSSGHASSLGCFKVPHSQGYF
jgi:hypothetical protein